MEPGCVDGIRQIDEPPANQASSRSHEIENLAELCTFSHDIDSNDASSALAIARWAFDTSFFSVCEFSDRKDRHVASVDPTQKRNHHDEARIGVLNLSLGGTKISREFDAARSFKRCT